MIYLNDPDGRKETRLSDRTVPIPDELLNLSGDFICKYLVQSERSNLFFAQNMSTHLAHILSLINIQKADISKIYISDHEISWIKEMIEIPKHQPDATHSNYHLNEDVTCPTLDVEVIPYDSFEQNIADVRQPAVFYLSHVSRLTGELSNLASIYQVIKENNPESILIVDGAQSIGAMDKIKVDNVCDVYLGLSSKFIGAEPHLGFAFMSESFFEKYVIDRNNYTSFDTEKHAKDILSLWDSLQNPLYKSSFSSYIKELKEYAIKKIALLDDSLIYNPSKQVSHFLTLNFGSVKDNKAFVDFAANKGIIISENSGWRLTELSIPLVRIGLSVRTTQPDLDKLIETVTAYIKK